MSDHHLAQLNVATLRAPLDSPELKDFVDNLDGINELAERSPGFIWRLKGDGGDATSLRPLGEMVIVNLSVWRDAEALKSYVYKGPHVEIMRRRREWFTRMADVYLALWWIPAGHEPTMIEAIDRLERLRLHGPSRDVFTFAEAYLPPDAPRGSEPFSFADPCPVT